MSSFELRYQGRILEPFQSSKDVDAFLKNLTMSSPREQVPEVLKGSVNLDTWMNTYDSVMEVYHSNANYVKAMFNPFLWGCCCLYPAQKEASSRTPESRWHVLEVQQTDVYKPLGIQVSLLKETIGEAQGGRYQIVGLKFAIPNNNPAVSKQPAAASKSKPRRRSKRQSKGEKDMASDDSRSHVSDMSNFSNVSPTVKRKSINIVEQLGELAKLHLSGALSDDEFALAKARVLMTSSDVGDESGGKSIPV